MDQFSTALDPSYARKRRRRRNLDHRPRTTCNRWSLLHPLILLFLVITPIAAAPSNCLRFADYDYINQLFIDGGPGYKVFLCPSKTYRLSGTIVFTAADQELATYGYPTGSERAILLVAGDMATAIQGDCRRCARVGIASLVIDGNRSKLGRMKDVDSSTGLIVLGNNDGQAVRNTWIKDPRGFTGIHIREGDKLSCTGAIIEKNEIGPVGEEYRPEVDGPDPEMSPLGRPLADGISIACRDSFVRDNTFYDNTDAAIVIYCSPGTLIHANRITARKSSAMAGILAVDSTPFDGDYKGMIIKGNTIDAATRAIRVGIGIGAPVWSDDIDTILKGGSVLANGIKGRYMGFGIAAAGLDGWTFKDNWDEARHQGIKSDRCFDEPVNPDPMAFLYYSEGIKNSVFQPGFVDKEFQYVVCIDGLESTAPPKPKDNPPQEVATTAEVAVPTSSPVSKITTGNEVMDDILEHSQQRMMEAIEHLAKRVDILANSAVPAPLAPAAGKGAQLSADVATSLADLQERVGSLETRQKSLLDTATKLRSAIQGWDTEMSSFNEWQYDMLLDVQHRLGIYLSGPESTNPQPQVLKEIAAQRLSRLNQLSERAKLIGRQAIADTQGVAGWGTIFRWIFAQGIFGFGIVYYRRWVRRDRHSKLS